MALRCPRLFHYRYVEKLAEPEVMPEARIGKAVHAALEHALRGVALGEALARGRDLVVGEIEKARFDQLIGGIPHFLTRLEGFRKRHRVGRQLIEFQLAVRDDFSSTAFYAGDAFYRGVLDIGFVYDDGTLAVVDHKTGARYRNLAVVDQLEGYAVLGICGMRHVRRIWLGIHWVGDADMEWQPILPAAHVQRELVPRVLANIEAAALAVDDGPRPNPGVWCERCNYRSVCPTGIEFRFEPVDDDIGGD